MIIVQTCLNFCGGNSVDPAEACHAKQVIIDQIHVFDCLYSDLDLSKPSPVLLGVFIWRPHAGISMWQIFTLIVI